MNVRDILERLGYRDLVPADWYTRIDAWREWYEGTTDWHSYTVYNGNRHISCTRRSLNMAKKVCEDKADLLLNERVEIIATPRNTAAQNRAQELLDDVLEANNFWVQGNQLIELASSLGTAALVAYTDRGAVRIDYLPAECVFPLAWSAGRVTECAFASTFTDGKAGLKTYLNLHVLENGKYTVYNRLFDKDGKEIPLPEGVLPAVITGSELPYFQLLRPNIANNIVKGCPMGVSVYAGAIDILRGIDLVYDSYQNEFILGKKRVFLDGSVLKIDTQSGERIPVFDPNDTTFYSLPGEDDPKKVITESNMELRVNEHRQALQDGLDLLAEKCGFGKGYYKFDADNVKTATEVVSQNSQLYRKVRKDEIVLEPVLVGLARAILRLAGYTEEVDISVSFDDSIIEDKEAIFKRALLEKQSGLIDDIEYHMRVDGMTEEAATEFVAKMRGRATAPPDAVLVGGGA